MQPSECRAEVFRERGQEVLGSVVQATHIAMPDPFDVEQVHPDARTVFRRTLDRINADGTSRAMLIQGEAGCGKTHLIRSLRSQTHRLGQGVVAYVHMTSEHGDYRRYLLRQVVRSLNDHYIYEPERPQQSSAMDLIGEALVERFGLPAGAGDSLREADDATLAELVGGYADSLADAVGADGRQHFAGVDLNTLRIFLYRQSEQAAIRRRAGMFLNGDPLSDGDWRRLAALPRDCDRGPAYMLGQIARIATAVFGSPLVICVDQIEASDITGGDHAPFLRAVGTACELIENVPRLMVLLSCLDAAYSAHAPRLIKSYRDRIENDPAPTYLVAARSAAEIGQIVSRRLKWLYESEGLEHVPPDSVYPMPEDLPEQLQRQHLRTVLQQIQGYWERCHSAARILEWDGPPNLGVSDPDVSPETDRLRLAWNEFRTTGNYSLNENEESRLDLLVWALLEGGNESPDVADVDIEHPAELGPVPYFSAKIARARADPVSLLIGLCEKDPRGGGLYNQIASLRELRRETQRLVVVRSIRFARTGKTADQVAALERTGDAAMVIEETGWQTFQAMRTFLQERTGGFSAAAIREWRLTDAPLAGMPEISALLKSKSPRIATANRSVDAAASDTERLPPVNASHVFDSESLDAPPPYAESDDSAAGPIVLGRSDDLSPADVTFDPQRFLRHTAIFGESGCGKNVLALSIVERLLALGVSVILLDHQGALATYAVPEAWNRPTGAPDEHRRRPALRAAVDVHVYTPGCATGRPLVLPILPSGLRNTLASERREQVEIASLILCEVCAPSPAKFLLYLTILSQAVDLLCVGDEQRSLDDLQQLLLQAPESLLAGLPDHKARHCEDVGRKLNERRVAHGWLLSEQGERLDLTRMLSASPSGRARLNVVSTQFLDGGESLIWVAQFLAAANRYFAGSAAPEGRLRALLMFDDADRYVPAKADPAAKRCMKHFLSRASEAGVGVLFLGENAGDFDQKNEEAMENIFVGRQTAPRAIERLRGRLGTTADRLPTKTRGQFLLSAGSDVRDIAAHMCLVRPTPILREQLELIAAGTKPDAAS